MLGVGVRVLGFRVSGCVVSAFLYATMRVKGV